MGFPLGSRGVGLDGGFYEKMLTFFTVHESSLESPSPFSYRFKPDIGATPDYIISLPFNIDIS